MATRNDYRSKIPTWVYKLPWKDILEVSSLHKIPSQLFAAIIMTESSGNQLAKRFEPNWKYFFDPLLYAENLHISEEEEREHQQTSVGLCQVMFAVMRELGFGGTFENAFDVPINLQYGAIKLNQCLAKWPYWYDAASAYNHGSPWRIEGSQGRYYNNDYVLKVRGYVRSFSWPDSIPLCITESTPEIVG